MRSVSKLALGSVICAGVALALGCVMLLGPIVNQLYFCTEQGMAVGRFIAATWLGAALVAVALATAALSRRSVYSSERRGRAQARVGYALGMAQIPLLCLAMIFVDMSYGCGS
jgi:hypothetical protein